MGLLDALFGSAKQSEAELALLAQIRQHPDDDAPRLAYANWLTEQKNPLGEYIRCDVEQAALDEDDPRRGELVSRCDELMDQHGKKWVKPLKELELEPVTFKLFVPSMWFERGMIENLTIDKRGIIPGKVKRLFELAPSLRRLTFERCTPDFVGIAGCPEMQRIRALDLSGEIRMTGSDLVALLASPYLVDLQELDLGSKDFGDVVVSALVGSRLKALKVLKLRSCRLGTDAIKKLAQWPGLANVEELELGYNDCDADGARAIVASPHLVKLRTFDLGDNQFGEGATDTFASARLPNLTTLRLRSNRIGPQGLQALLASPIAQQLVDLELGFNDLRDEGLQMLAAWPGLAHVKKLRLAGNEITAGGMQALLASPHLAELVEFEIPHNTIGASGAQALVGCAKLQKLHKLNAYGLECGDEWETRLVDHFGKDIVDL